MVRVQSARSVACWHTTGTCALRTRRTVHVLRRCFEVRQLAIQKVICNSVPRVITPSIVVAGSCQILSALEHVLVSERVCLIAHTTIKDPRVLTLAGGQCAPREVPS